MKTEDESMTVEQSFLRNLQQETFQSVCKSCQLKWQTQKCKENNPVKSICVDQGCQKHVFSCGLESCNVCQSSHETCKTVQLVAFVKFLKEMSDYQKKFFKRLYIIDEERIEEIKKNREELAKKISQGSLDAQSVQILEIVSGAKKVDNFYGRQSDKLYMLLKKKAKQTNQYEEELERMYAKSSKEKMLSNIKTEKEIFDHFLKGTRPNSPPSSEEMPFIESPLLTICLHELYMASLEFYKNKTYEKYGYLQTFNEEKRAFDKKNIDFLKASFHNPTRCQLLFRASQHSFAAAKFHQKCDGKAKTLTIIRTNYQKTIFCYAQMAWPAHGAYANDTTSRSCMVWLLPTGNVKLTLAQQAYSLYGSNGYGPYFGSHDIRIDNSGNGQTSFPHSYGTNYGGASQQNYTRMTGCPDNANFRAVQYEVYQVYY